MSYIQNTSDKYVVQSTRLNQQRGKHAILEKELLFIIK